MYQLTKIPQMSEVCYIPKKKSIKRNPAYVSKIYVHYATVKKQCFQ